MDGYAPARFPLMVRPTPLHRLPRMSEDLGVDLWIKRDDLSGLAMGGNKVRKLEFLIADALQQGAEVVVSCGSTQSNFVRMLGAACAMAGLQCAATVMDLPFNTPEDRPDVPPLDGTQGNMVLDQLLQIDLRHHPDGTWDELFDLAEELAQEYEEQGKNVYRIPIGGSTVLGAYSFVLAAEEIVQQAEPFDWIVFPTSSGSTHTGLAYGLYGTRTNVLGIACDPEPEIADDFSALAKELNEAIGGERILEPSDFQLNLDYVGPGYGVPSPAAIDAIQTLASREGILLDPVYTGKAFAGLIDLIETGQISGRVLFWHTGGVPALFAVPEQYGLTSR